MKWFKHDADAHDNQKLQLFMAKYPRAPLEAYGFYWVLLEIVAKQMDATDRCEVEYPTAYLARICGISARKLVGFVQDLREIRAIDAEVCAKTCKIKIPKLLEKRDEHTRKLRSKTGATPEQDKEQDKEVEEEVVDSGNASAPAESSFAEASKAINEKLMPLTAKPLNTSIVHSWLNAGADLHLDILPTITTLLASMSDPPTSLKYFDRAVLQAVANRKTIPKLPEAKHGKPKQRHTGFDQQDYRAGTEGFDVLD